MEFLSFDAPKKSLTLKKGPIPKPGLDEVLVRVVYSGVCGTDIHIMEGSFPCKESEPVTLGHEFVGVIEAIGSGIQNFKVGQRVASDPNYGCNMCNECHAGCYHLCEHGFKKNVLGIWKNGGWATHCLVPEYQIYIVPENVRMEHAALVEPLSCLAHGWDIMSPINVGQRVLIVGAGIIGLLWACILHLHGLRKTVTISEPQEKRQAIVKKIGLDYEVKNPNDLTKPIYDVAIDCSGNGRAMESAITLLNRGGRFCIFGVTSPQTKIFIEPYQMYKKELSIHGSMINPFTFPKALNLVEAMSDTYLNYEKLGIKVYSLSQHKEAFEDLKKGITSKAMFKM